MEITRGSLRDYDKFARWHYQTGRPGFVSDVFLMKGLGKEDAGIITFSSPPANCAGRNAVFGGLFAHFEMNRSEKLRFVNKNFKTVSRIVLLPDYRGLGFGHKFLSLAMDFTKADCFEALSVMGGFSGFFEKAGFHRCAKVPVSRKKERLADILDRLEIPTSPGDKKARFERVMALGLEDRAALRAAVASLLHQYGRKRMLDGEAERLEFAVGRLRRQIGGLGND